MDQSTLATAALVSRAWYPRATSCLYYTVVIASRASYDLLVKQLRTSSRVQRWLQSTHEVALGYDPYEIALGYGLNEVTFGYGLNHSEGLSFLDAFPLVFGHACPALQVLDIGHILRPNMHPTFHFALRQLQHIVSLRLHDVELSNSTQLQRIVCAFMCLEELVLDDVLLKPQLPSARLQDDRFRGPQCNLRLKRLRVEAYSDNIKAFERMANWLVCSGICSSLVQLVTVFHGEDTDLATEHVNRLLETTGHSLTSFYCQSYLNLRYRSPCNLVHNTALRHLTLRLNVDPYQRTEDSDWAQAASELRGAFSTIRSYQLEHIAIHFRFELTGPLDQENFSQSCKKLEADSQSLYNVVVGPYFDALTDVKIEMQVVYHPDEHSMELAHDFARAVAPLLRRLFMPWHDRGLLANVTYVTSQY